MDKPQPILFGTSRIRLVDGLLALVDQVQALGEARWVSLEAPSGWGKTRVAQALYERLAARQTQAYWPATILEATAAANADDISYRRKRIFPDPARLDRAAGRLSLDADEINKLPRKVETVYQELWDKLPLTAQQALVLATLAIPENESAWQHRLLGAAAADCEDLRNGTEPASTTRTPRPCTAPAWR